MPTNDMNSVIARTTYRMKWQLQRLLGTKQTPTSPQISAQTAATTQDTPPDLKTFVDSVDGNGIYGKWIVDNYGLPAYQYEINQYESEEAQYPVSTGAFRRDNWHQIGNERVTGLASNEGTVQVFIGDQGFMFLNHFSHGQLVSLLGVIWEVLKILADSPFILFRRFFLGKDEPGVIERLVDTIIAPFADRRDDLKHAYAGGFGYVKFKDDDWSTAYRYHPDLRDNSKRVFGMGYFRTACTNKGITVDRTVYAPPGDVPALLTDVNLINNTDEDVSLSYYEYWDINIQQIIEQLLRTNSFGAAGDSKRRHLNSKYTPCIKWDENASALRFHFHPPHGGYAPHIPDAVNNFPDDIFLVDLSGEPDAYFTDKTTFFGAGDAEHPDFGDDPAENNGGRKPIMPYCMVLRRDVEIPKGSTKRLRFAYGTIEPDDCFDCRTDDVTMPDDWMKSYHDAYDLNRTQSDPLSDLSDHWKQQIAYFSVANPTYLHREMAWHTYYLLSSTLKNKFFDLRVVPQGSAYLYLHGIDGVPRDFALYVIPLSYINPSLAKDMLAFIMQMTDGYSGQIAYSYTGNGHLSGAIIHEEPSDIDLFFLLAIAEYIAVTGDQAFLDEPMPFYTGRNQPRDKRVINHVRLAYRHLMEDIGIGENGLFRVRDGDWSDDVVVRNVFPSNPLVSPRRTVQEGESVLNTQMALYILPRIADVLIGATSSEAQQLGHKIRNDFAAHQPTLTAGLKAMWQQKNGDVYGHYARAILRRWSGEKYILHQKLEEIDLEAQVWPLIGDYESEDDRETLVKTIYDKLDKDSKIGAPLSGRTVWPAIAQLLTWGYTHHHPAKAWESFCKQSLTNRANQFGKWWSNILSGPDGVNDESKGISAGFTYESPPATPMTDFPVMNNNQHAMALLGMLRVCGIESHMSGQGIRIRPQIPECYKLDTALLKLDVTPTRITGTYHAQNTGTCTLFICISETSTTVQVTIDDTTTTQQRDENGFVSLPLTFDVEDVIEFAVWI